MSIEYQQVFEAGTTRYKRSEGFCECPSCGHRLNAATPVTAISKPQPGDLSLCINCAQFLRYTDSMTLEIFPEEDLLKLSIDECLDLFDMRSRLLKANSLVKP